MSTGKITRKFLERTLEPRAERQQFREHLARRVVTNCCGELGERERITCRLPDDPVANRRGEIGRQARHHVQGVALAQRRKGKFVEAGPIEGRYLAIA